MEIHPERFLSETRKCIRDTSFKSGDQTALRLMAMNQDKVSDEKFSLDSFAGQENDQEMGESKENESLLNILDTEAGVQMEEATELGNIFSQQQETIHKSSENQGKDQPNLNIIFDLTQKGLLNWLKQK